MSDSGKRCNDREAALILRMAADLEALHAAFDAWQAAGSTLSGIVGGATVLRIERHITGELSDDARVHRRGGTTGTGTARNGPRSLVDHTSRSE